MERIIKIYHLRFTELYILLDNGIGITLLSSAFSKLQQFSLKFWNPNLEVFVVPEHHLQYLLRYIYIYIERERESENFHTCKKS